jgi:hypothetical protein
MPRVGFEPTTPVFERAKAAHALDRAPTEIGVVDYGNMISYSDMIFFLLISKQD